MSHQFQCSLQIIQYSTGLCLWPDAGGFSCNRNPPPFPPRPPLPPPPPPPPLLPPSSSPLPRPEFGTRHLHGDADFSRGPKEQILLQPVACPAMQVAHSSVTHLGPSFVPFSISSALTTKIALLQEEIEKVKKRRLDREKERADQEEMLNLLQRERGVAEAVELERKEEEFHLEQAKMRAKQRIRDGRPHPIDILTANLHLAEEFDVGADEPYKAFVGLSLQEVQELHASVMSMQVGALRFHLLHSILHSSYCLQCILISVCTPVSHALIFGFCTIEVSIQPSTSRSANGMVLQVSGLLPGLLHA